MKRSVLIVLAISLLLLASCSKGSPPPNSLLKVDIRHLEDRRTVVYTFSGGMVDSEALSKIGVRLENYPNLQKNLKENRTGMIDIALITRARSSSWSNDVSYYYSIEVWIRKEIVFSDSNDDFFLSIQRKIDKSVVKCFSDKLLS